MSTLAGGGAGAWSDGVGGAAAFNSPGGVAVDAIGNILVGDVGNNRIRRVTPSGGAFPLCIRFAMVSTALSFFACYLFASLFD